MILSPLKLNILNDGNGCFLTVLIADSLEAFIVLQAMRLDAVISISFIHESHSESVSFLCPQDWTWTNTNTQCDRTGVCRRKTQVFQREQKREYDIHLLNLELG